MKPFAAAGTRGLLGALSAVAFLLAASAAEASSWRLDPSKSRLGFSGVQTGAPFKGRFTRYSAVIAFDPDHLGASHVAVTIDLASAVTGDAQRDGALPGKDWFDVAEFPRAKFESTAIRRKGPNRYEAAGTLSLRGVSRPIVVPFTLDINGPAAHARGQVNLTRTVFGVGQGSWASGQWVALTVGVDFDILATRAN